MNQIISLKPHRDKRIQTGHVWIFSNELEDGFQNCSSGEVVEIQNAKGQFVGMGTINPHSLIAVRILTHKRIEIDKSFFREKIRSAILFRKKIFGSENESCRLIYSEADGLPGLIVDRIGNCLVLQTLTAGMDNFLSLIVEVLQEELCPSAIVAANDSQARLLEGLPQTRELVYGQSEFPIEFCQDKIYFYANPLSGQKTGFFFDQRKNRQLLQSYILQEAKVLDLFCYTGSFGLYSLSTGAKQVTFVDDSQSALDVTKQAVQRNGWIERANFIKADIFPWLKSAEEKYDTIILDPPALAKSRTKVPAALRAYRDLNSRAMMLVKSGGLLATASCSGLVTAEAWKEALSQAAVKSGRTVKFIAQGYQSPDHPVLAAMPETAYLKFAIAIVDK